MSAVVHRLCLATVVFATFYSPAYAIGGAETNQSVRRQSYLLLGGKLVEGAQVSGTDHCGLHTIAYAMQHRRKLSPPQRAALSILPTRPSLDTSIVAGNFLSGL